MSASDPAIDISICVCTYKRPQQLQNLVAALARQELGSLRVEIVVADNDPAGSAQAVLRELAATSPLPIVSRHVTTPNISLARNATVHAAQGEWVAFVDDDEEPVPNWLAALTATQRSYRADAVFGPVWPRYDPAIPEWIQTGGFFDRQQYPTGTHIDARDARTGNALVRRKLLLDIPGPFDPAYGRTGGEDTVLFAQLAELGTIMVWCDEATVSEYVPATRATLRWLLQRSYRGGQSYIQSELRVLAGGAKWRRAGYLGAKAIVQMGVAALLALVYAPFARPRALKWLRTAVAQVGKLTSLVGHRYQEYRH